MLPFRVFVKSIPNNTRRKLGQRSTAAASIAAPEETPPPSPAAGEEKDVLAQPAGAASAPEQEDLPPVSAAGILDEQITEKLAQIESEVERADEGSRIIDAPPEEISVDSGQILIEPDTEFMKDILLGATDSRTDVGAPPLFEPAPADAATDGAFAAQDQDAGTFEEGIQSAVDSEAALIEEMPSEEDILADAFAATAPEAAAEPGYSDELMKELEMLEAEARGGMQAASDDGVVEYENESAEAAPIITPAPAAEDLIAQLEGAPAEAISAAERDALAQAEEPAAETEAAYAEGETFSETAAAEVDSTTETVYAEPAPQENADFEIEEAALTRREEPNIQAFPDMPDAGNVQEESAALPEAEAQAEQPRVEEPDTPAFVSEELAALQDSTESIIYEETAALPEENLAPDAAQDVLAAESAPSEYEPSSQILEPDGPSAERPALDVHFEPTRIIEDVEISDGEFDDIFNEITGGGNADSVLSDNLSDGAQPAEEDMAKTPKKKDKHASDAFEKELGAAMNAPASACSESLDRTAGGDYDEFHRELEAMKGSGLTETEAKLLESEFRKIWKEK
jgi:hypothetical protein